MLLRSNTVRRPVVSENTPPAIAKVLNTRRRGAARVGLSNRRPRTTSNIIGPATLRAPHFQAEQAKKKQAVKDKVNSILPTPTTNIPKCEYDSSKCSTQGDECTMGTTSPGLVKLTIKRRVAIPTSECLQGCPLDAEKRDELEDSVIVERPYTVVFPRLLPRPEYRAVSREAILACDTTMETDEAAVIYHLDKSLQDSRRWFRELRHVNVCFNKSAIPDAYDVRITGDAAPPTHILAVKPIASPSSKQPCPVKLYPCHSTVMALQCRNLPPFSPSPSDLDSMCKDGDCLTIPSRHLSLPCPESFHLVLAFLYTKNPAPLLHAFLPSPPPPEILGSQRNTVLAFGTKIGRTCSPEQIMEHILAVLSFWKNVCALCILDDILWDVLDIVWKTLLTAMSVATGEPHLMLPCCAMD